MEVEGREKCTPLTYNNVVVGIHEIELNTLIYLKITKVVNLVKSNDKEA